MIGYAGVDASRDKILVQSRSRTVDGTFVMNGWFEVLPRDASEAALGRAVLEALRRTTDKHPSVGWDAQDPILDEFLALAGVRSYSTYLRGNRSVTVAIREPGDVITFTPMRSGGDKGPGRGFTFMRDAELSIPVGSSEEEVGHSAAQALIAAT